ncbi:hypothetical protein FWH30_02990 [Microgenomates group bacterium]|nr:hypothetical protein [Microgenomates group bacterium]
MKKEVVLAIVISLFVCFAITFLIIFLRHSSQNDPHKNIVNRIALEGNNSSPSATASSQIQIFSPSDEDVVTQPDVTISGHAFPSSLLVIFVNDSDYIITSDESGNFSAPLTLEAGSNVISIHGFDANNQPDANQITVIYSNKSLEETLVTDQDVRDATNN